MGKLRKNLTPFKAISSINSSSFLRFSLAFDAILDIKLPHYYVLFLYHLLHNYISYFILPSNHNIAFNSFIKIPSNSSVLQRIKRPLRCKIINFLIEQGFIVKASFMQKGKITYYITEHFLATYFFFLQLPPKVAEEKFSILEKGVGEIMRKRPNYEDTEAILKACVNLDSNVEVADNSAGKESAVGKKGKKILRKPKSKELKEDQWLRAVKRAFKEKALSYDKKCAEEALSKTNANLIQKSRPEDVNTFKEKADFAADAFMQYFIKEGDAVASINRFAARFSSWMHNGFKPKAEGGGKNALTTDAERQRNKERYENLMKNLGGNSSEY